MIKNDKKIVKIHINFCLFLYKQYRLNSKIKKKKIIFTNYSYFTKIRPKPPPKKIEQKTTLWAAMAVTLESARQTLCHQINGLLPM